MYKSKEEISQLIQNRLFFDCSEEELPSAQIEQKEAIELIHQIRQDDREAIGVEFLHWFIGDTDELIEKAIKRITGVSVDE